MIKSIEYILGQGLSDHVCLMYNPDVYIPELKELKPKFCYHKGNYVGMNKHLKKRLVREITGQECRGSMVIFFH